ncbi:MAG: hypothetical protein FWH18_10335 [Marinilabiliaceae bacterium]|nr:hypothetical protein [Marinilabiliaceae bacterium]
MKKTLLILSIAALATIAGAQNWVEFTKSNPAISEVNLLENSSTRVKFEVTVPGIYVRIPLWAV